MAQSRVQCAVRYLEYFIFVASGARAVPVPLCTSIMASPLNLSSFMDDLVHNLRRRRAEKDLSHDTLPTGKREDLVTGVAR